MNTTEKIAFQGELGAYSHQACNQFEPNMEAFPCKTFEDAIEEVISGRADLAMLPVENSTYGRVPDMHRLLPESGLNIVGEEFVRVKINLLAIPGTKLENIKIAKSHAVLLGQCQNFLRKHDLEAVSWGDTAGAAMHISQLQDPVVAALGTSLAGEIYGLEILKSEIEDNKHNATRFVIMSKEQKEQFSINEKIKTCFVFRVRNIPAALYKAMGGFATNGVNMVRLESYMLDGSFTSTQFFAEIEGHPEDANVKLALEELSYYSTYIKMLGSFNSHS
jgi:prephenate dehydratase